MNRSKRSMHPRDSVPDENPHQPSSFRRTGIRDLFLSAVVVLLISAAVPGRVMAQDDFNSFYDKASLSFRQAQYDEALKFYKKANRMRENSNLECLWGIAQTYSKLGAYKNTLKTCDRMIELSGDNLYFLVKAWNMRGNELSDVAMRKEGKVDEEKLRDAELAYREVLQLSGSNMAHYNLGVTMIRLNRTDEGISELRTYLEQAEEEDTAEQARKLIDEPRRAVENFAPDFSIVTSDGEYVSSDELRDKVVLVDFWGAWCGPCVHAVPFLSGLAKKHRKDAFVLLSVDVNDEEAKWREFIEQNDMNWTQARDGSRTLQRLFQVNGFPTYILIDHEGIVQYRGLGSSMQTEDEISGRIKKALKALAASPKKRAKSPEKPSENSSVGLAGKPAGSARTGMQKQAAPKTAAAFLKADGEKVFTFRIPKPSFTVSRQENPNPAAGRQIRTTFYRLQVENWASLPDDLFTTSKNMMPCSTNTIGLISTGSPTRLEIIIQGERGRILRSICNPPQPQILRSLLFTVPDQLKPDRIYITLKDRLTGNSVQSDLVPLP